MKVNRESILDYFVNPDIWDMDNLLVNLRRDLGLLGCSCAVAGALEGFQQRVLPLAHLTFNPRAGEYTYGQLERRIGKGWLQGRGINHQVPFGMVVGNRAREGAEAEEVEEIEQKWINLYVKGGGSGVVAALEEFTSAQLNGPNFRGFALHTDMLPDLMNRRKWGAQRGEEGLREYVHGLLAWKLIAGESLEYGEDEVHKLFTGGFVIPLVVMAQPELSEAVIPIELELGHGRLSGKDLLVTMLSLTPAPTRLAPQTELDSAARRALSNERLIYRMADNILQLLRYGIMWHKSSWHPQNFYAVLEKSTGKEPPAMLMADAGDMLFFWDYFTQEHQGEIAEDELMVIMLAEALHNIRFMPLLDKSEKPQGATFKFYEHLLGRDLTPEEKKYCGLQVGERDVLDNYVGISKNMARQILERVYDQKRWEYGRGLRDKLAGGYGLEVELDDAADFRARVEKWF